MKLSFLLQKEIVRTSPVLLTGYDFKAVGAGPFITLPVIAYTEP